MPTLSNLIDSTLMYMYGMSTHQDQETHITQAINSTDLTFTVDDATILSKGLTEIGTELMQVKSVDTSAGTVTIAPYGRGYRGTTAVSHLSDNRIVAAPLIPRSFALSAINETILSVFPDLYAVGTATIVSNPVVVTYALPAGALDILSISYETIGPSKEWEPIRRWRVDKNADPTTFPSGSTISIYDGINPGRSIRVVYTKQPTQLSNLTDDFATVTGLPESAMDVIRYGSVYRMAPFFDAPHLAGQTAEADFAANVRPIGSASTFGKYALQLYQIRLTEESKKLSSIYPVRSHYTK